MIPTVTHQRVRRLSAPVLIAIVVALLGQGSAWAQSPGPAPSISRITLRAETTDFTETGRHAEIVDFCRVLAQASPLVEYRVVGVSPEGRDIPILILARDGQFTPETARAAGKSIVFVNNCIHAGEVAGKDASLMLARDIAAGPAADLLEDLVLVVMPIFNVDGHERFSAYSRINQNGPAEMGWRVTAQNLNLNRDFSKADSPEMLTWLRVFNAWLPELHFDNHSTDGGDWQFDVATATGTGPGVDPDLDHWLDQRLMPDLYAGLRQAGHRPCPYFHLIDRYDPSRGIRSGGQMSPRFSTGYVAMRNRASILVETHVYKPYRTRVMANYWIMRRALEHLNAHPGELARIVAQADRRASAARLNAGPDNSYPLTSAYRDGTEPFVFEGFTQTNTLSELSGQLRIQYDHDRPYTLTVPHQHEVEPATLVTPPHGYLIPRAFTEVIARIRAHGLLAYEVDAPFSGRFQVDHVIELKYPADSFEGRHRPTYRIESIESNLSFDKGDIYIPVAQPAARLVLHLLEPSAPDSFLAWGFFNAMLEQKEYAELHVLEGIARDMLAADPALRTEFEKKIAADPAFASNPRERLYFFYRRSPYWDQRSNVYPIVRCPQRPDVAMSQR